MIDSAVPTNNQQQEAAERRAGAQGARFVDVVMAQLTQAEDAPGAQGGRDAVSERAQKRRAAFLRQDDPTSRAQAQLAGAAQTDPMGLQAAVQREAVTPAETRTPTEPHSGLEQEAAHTMMPAHEAEHQTCRGIEQATEPAVSDARTSGPRQMNGTAPMQSAQAAAPFLPGVSGTSGTQGSQPLPGAIGLEAHSAAQVLPVAGAGAGKGNEGAEGERANGLPAATALGTLAKRSAFKMQLTDAARPEVDADAFAAQAAKGLAAAMKKEGGTVVMRLSPEHLGLLSVKVQTADGGVTARVEARESAARDLLVQHIDKLHAALEAHGVRVEGIDVVRMGDSQSGGQAAAGTGQHMQDQARQGAESPGGSAGRRDASGGLDADSHGFMEEPLGLYLHGVELRVDAIA